MGSTTPERNPYRNAFGYGAVDVQMRQEVVEQQQKAHARQKAHGGGQPAHHALTFRHFNGRHEQAPYAGGDHHAGGKAQKRFLKQLAHLLLHEEREGRPQRGACKGHGKGDYRA